MRSSLTTLPALVAITFLCGCAKEEPPIETTGEDATETPEVSTPTPAPAGSDGTADEPPEAAPAEDDEASDPLAAWSEHFNNLYAEGDVYSAGLPTEEGLRQAAARDVKLVISLLPDEQHAELITYDEAALLEELGVRFERIPVSTQTFSRSDVDRFAELMTSADGPVLVHCRSANRVGGIWAAYQALHKRAGLVPALEAGEAMGLRSEQLAAAVRRMAAE